MTLISLSEGRRRPPGSTVLQSGIDRILRDRIPRGVNRPSGDGSGSFIAHSECVRGQLIIRAGPLFLTARTHCRTSCIADGQVQANSFRRRKVSATMRAPDVQRSANLLNIEFATGSHPEAL